MTSCEPQVYAVTCKCYICPCHDFLACLWDENSISWHTQLHEVFEIE